MPLPKELEGIISDLPTGHPHRWTEQENKDYDQLILTMSTEQWCLLDDLVYGRKCAETCTLDHPVPLSTSIEVLEEDDDEVITTSLELLLEKNYDDMNADELSLYAQLIDEFSAKDEPGRKLVQVASNGCVCHGPGHPDQQWSVHDVDCPAANSSWPSIGVPQKVVSKPKDPPKKGAPCDCDGPPKGFYKEHVRGCPQHSNYDPEFWTPNNALIGTATTPVGTSSYKPLCKHDRGKVFNLQDGLKIKAISWRDVKTLDDPDTDIGVYMYDGWANNVLVSPGLEVPWGEPEYTKQVLIDWPDFSVPDKSIPIMDIVNWMIEQIREGKKLETACMGGHGRTGTMLALLLVAQGVTPGAAIARVRKSHCESGIENKKQADFIAEFYAEYHGNEDWRKDKKLRKLFEKEAGNGKKDKPFGFSSDSSSSKSSSVTTTKPNASGPLFFTRDNKHGYWIASRFDVVLPKAGFSFETDKKIWVYHGKAVPPEAWKASTPVEFKGKEVK